MNNQSWIENNPMEDNSISERGRRQIEQVWQLDNEELQVEEVDEEESSDDEYPRVSAGASASGEYTYYTSIVNLHSYLGEVEDTHSRLAFLDDGAVRTLPLFPLEGVVLFPEAILPLRVVFPNFIAAVERALEQDDACYTIGVVRVYRDPNNGRLRLSTTGTTAEIRRYRRLEDGSVNIVARGQQRFRLERCWIDVEGLLCGEVHVIQEDVPLRTPRDAVGKLAPLRNIQAKSMSSIHHSCEEGNNSDALSEGSFESELSLTERRLHHYALVSSRSSEEYDECISSDDERSVRFYECQPEGSPLDNYTRPSHLGLNIQNADRAFWPGWVYRMYDSYVLARKAADNPVECLMHVQLCLGNSCGKRQQYLIFFSKSMNCWKEVVKAPNMDSFVTKPDILSFHIASEIPISDTARQELLEIDGTTYRLRKEIELLERFDKIRCKTCQTLIAKRSNMLVMSSSGPLGAYANIHGYVQEVMILTRTTGIAVTGPPGKEYMWFPSYAWSVAECIMCGTQMGWYFSATEKKKMPQAFWALRSSHVVDETL